MRRVTLLVMAMTLEEERAMPARGRRKPVVKMNTPKEESSDPSQAGPQLADYIRSWRKKSELNKKT